MGRNSRKAEKSSHLANKVLFSNGEKSWYKCLLVSEAYFSLFLAAFFLVFAHYVDTKYAEQTMRAKLIHSAAAEFVHTHTSSFILVSRLFICSVSRSESETTAFFNTENDKFSHRHLVNRPLNAHFPFAFFAPQFLFHLHQLFSAQKFFVVCVHSYSQDFKLVLTIRHCETVATVKSL